MFPWDKTFSDRWTRGIGTSFAQEVLQTIEEQSFLWGYEEMSLLSLSSQETSNKKFILLYVFSSNNIPKNNGLAKLNFKSY